MGKIIEKIILSLGSVVAFLIVMTAWTLVAQAFVMVKLWDWFIVYHFKCHELPMFVAIGISLFLSALMPYQDEVKDNKTTLFIKVLLKPWIILLIGYCVQLFM